MGAKNSATSTGNKQGPDNKPMHKCGEVGSYGSLCNSGKASRADGSRVWERDHVPAKGTLYARAVKRFGPFDPDVAKCVKGKVESRGMAIVIPRKVHRADSETCGSLNKPLMKPDAETKQSMKDAIKRDTDAIQAALDDTECGPAYAAAVKELKEFPFEDMIKEAVKECEG
ncbi:MAG: hypothetical protein E5Y16_02010 [Mesorhizobium sp.]|nr:MAG: hypothetical protein E5Y16_02010 [Mesorhizobium sp.]